MAMMGGIMSMAGGLVGAQGAMQEAEAKAKAAEYNAQVADRNRKVIKQQTHAAVLDKRAENKRVIHAFRANYGASNIDMSGSAVDVIHDTAIEQFLDIRRIKYMGKLKMLEQKDTATLDRMEAVADMQAGRISALSSILNGASGMFSSFGSMIGGGGGGGFGGFGGGGATAGLGGGGGGIVTPTSVFAPVRTDAAGRVLGGI